MPCLEVGAGPGSRGGDRRVGSACGSQAGSIRLGEYKARREGCVQAQRAGC